MTGACACNVQARAVAAAEQLHVLQEQHDALRRKLREAASEADAKDRLIQELRAQAAAASEHNDRSAQQEAQEALAAAEKAAAELRAGADAQLASVRWPECISIHMTMSGCPPLIV